MSTYGTGASEDEMSEPDNTYESLGARLASSTNLITTPSAAVTSQFYLHPRNSERSLSRHETNRRHRSHRHRHRKQSDSSRETDELDYNFRKMKLWMFLFTCLLFVLVVAFLLTHPKIGPFFREEIPDGLKLCVNCATLRNKAGSAGGLLEQLVSQDYPKYCCFKTVEQLLSLVEWYAHGYTQQEIQKVKDQYPVVENVRNSSVEPTVAHMYVSVSQGKLSFVRNGNDNNVDIYPRDTTLKIKETGYYFIYSRLLFNSSDFYHRVIYNESKEIDHPPAILREEVESRKLPGRVASLLVGIKLLDAGSEITLKHNGSVINGEGKENYFGLYMFGRVISKER